MPSGLENFFNSTPGQLGLAGLGGIAGAFPTSGSQTTNGTQNTSGEQNSNYNNFLTQLLQSLSQTTSSTNGTTGGTSSTSAVLTPQTQALLDQLTKSYSSLTAPSLKGYEAQQTQQINHNSDLQQQAAASVNAARGLSSSPVAATTANNIDNARFAQVNQMQAGIPLLQDKMNLDHLGAAANFFNMIPKGSTTSSTGFNDSDTNSTTSTNQMSNQVGGGTGYQSNNSSTNTNQNTQNKSGGGVGGAVGGIASVLASLFSDERLKEDIEPIAEDKAVERVMAIKPVSWGWKGSGMKDGGVLAQALAKINPAAVHTDPEGSGFLKVDYTKILGDVLANMQLLNRINGVA